MSWSVTLAATMVTVQDSPPTKAVAGSRVKLPGPPEAVAGCAPLVAQLIENQLPVTSTGSLKVIVRLAQDGTPVAAVGRERRGDPRRRVVRGAGVGCADHEVGGVVASICGAVTLAQGGCRIRERRGRARFGAVGCAVANEIQDRGARRTGATQWRGGGDQGDLPGSRRTSRSCRWHPGREGTTSRRRRRPPGSGSACRRGRTR